MQKTHKCKLPLYRVTFGKIITCPVCGTQWIGDMVYDGVGDIEILDWSRFQSRGNDESAPARTS
ncbi:MAG TPA: hypothetical protein VGN33_15795 [Leifsonia sp.]|jgi:uncharacterized Zn finger protein (UPF0148 family)|nr:hypothetical protein [Leifsonia sp.]